MNPGLKWSSAKMTTEAAVSVMPTPAAEIDRIATRTAGSVCKTENWRWTSERGKITWNSLQSGPLSLFGVDPSIRIHRRPLLHIWNFIKTELISTWSFIKIRFPYNAHNIQSSQSTLFASKETQLSLLTNG